MEDNNIKEIFVEWNTPRCIHCNININPKNEYCSCRELYEFRKKYGLIKKSQRRKQ